MHRLLGSTSGVEFRHDATNPLPHDLVVVDETSMVSLPLMARLLAAVRPDATLVLVGDPYQLASVEAGAVLGEIVGSTPEERDRGPLVERVVLLERVHRFGADSAIAALAGAVRTGDADRALELLRDDDGRRADLDPRRRRGRHRIGPTRRRRARGRGDHRGAGGRRRGGAAPGRGPEGPRARPGSARSGASASVTASRSSRRGTCRRARCRDAGTWAGRSS